MASPSSSAAQSPLAQRWFGLGRFIGSHMVVIAPLCVILGAAFPQLFSWITPAVEALFAVMTFQSSMGTTARGILDVIRHPAHLLGCLAVLLIGMPLVGFVAGNLVLHGQHDIILGVVLEYCVPMGVTGLMWTEIYNGNKPLSIAVCVISTVLAPFTLPAMMQLLMGATVHIDVAGMMLDLAIMVAIPAVAGVLCNDLSHGKANAEVAPWIAPLGRVFLIAVLLANSTHIAGPIRQMDPTLVGTAALMLVLGMTGYFGGYVVARLMHADVSDSFSMGICCGCRNISSGAVLTAAYFPDITMFPVLMGTLFQHMIAGVFGWSVRRLEARNTPGVETVAPARRARRERRRERGRSDR
ncbi:bile acid:sodium symporter family protein [bacterium]|nr:bile acid:sodium symporter family protein [bacterium]